MLSFITNVVRVESVKYLTGETDSLERIEIRVKGKFGGSDMIKIIAAPEGEIEVVSQEVSE